MKLKVRSSENSEVLMKVIKNPITDHLPAGCNIISTCEKSRLVKTDDFVKSLDKSKPVAIVIGAMSQGDLDIDYANDSISVSAYPLSASVVCSKVCCSFESIWEIL
jgi:rRNA small subunit pseudouridine methyltransferase Nep1